MKLGAKCMNMIMVRLWLMVMIMMMMMRVKAELPRFKHQMSKSKSLSFLVVGDWGRRGQFNQSLVATQMGIVGQKLKVDFIISTGDNFYDDGLTGVHDPAFTQSFTNIYTAPSLQKQWYNVLGNHDYWGDALAQLNPVLRKRDKRWFCSRTYTVSAGVIDLFFVDTTPFVDKYFNDTKHTYDWRGTLPRRKYLSNLLKDLNKALKKSKATWKAVIGHHTIMSAGHHGITSELVANLLPILKTNNVDFYINGHDHCLEHIVGLISQIQFLTSGGGSKAWRGDIKPWKPEEELKLYYDGQGFMSMQVTRTRVGIVFYDVFGNVLYTWSSIKPEPDFYPFV